MSALDIADLRAKAEAQRIAYVQLLERGTGVGGVDHEQFESIMTCGEPIRVNPHAGLGEPRYVHVIPSGHLALRGPNHQPTEPAERHGEDVDDYSMCICGREAGHEPTDSEKSNG